MKHRLLILGTLVSLYSLYVKPGKKDTIPLSVTDIRMARQENLRMKRIRFR